MPEFCTVYEKHGFCPSCIPWELPCSCFLHHLLSPVWSSLTLLLGFGSKCRKSGAWDLRLASSGPCLSSLRCVQTSWGTLSSPLKLNRAKIDDTAKGEPLGEHSFRQLTLCTINAYLERQCLFMKRQDDLNLSGHWGPGRACLQGLERVQPSRTALTKDLGLVPYT